MAKFYEEGFNPDDLTVRVSELLVATADSSDEMIDKSVQEVLALLRERLKMDVVFVSEFVDGKRVFRYVENPKGQTVIPVGASDPLEESWCQRVVDGRMPEYIPKVSDLPQETKSEMPAAPFEIGTHLSTPITMKSGEVYGTLCSFSFSPYEAVQKRDLKNLQSDALLVADKLEKKRAREKAEMDSLGLQPKN